jgi:hypothetical protein
MGIKSEARKDDTQLLLTLVKAPNRGARFKEASKQGEVRMKARVIYESLFGNTKAIAEAVAEGLSEAFDTETLEVGMAGNMVDGIDLLVVGGPTHVFSMSRPATRKGGREQAAKLGMRPVSDGIGIREWLDGLVGGQRRMAAAFDTGAGRLGILPAGSAAKAEATRLQRLGYRVIDRPQQFLIMMEGNVTSLKPGELDRARKWGRDLAQLAKAA